MVDGIEFEKVGDEWLPVTTKDPKQRSIEEKRIVAHEREEKREGGADRRNKMIQKLIKAGLTDLQVSITNSPSSPAQLLSNNYQKNYHHRVDTFGLPVLQNGVDVEYEAQVASRRQSVVIDVWLVGGMITPELVMWRAHRPPRWSTRSCVARSRQEPSECPRRAPGSARRTAST